MKYLFVILLALLSGCASTQLEMMQQEPVKIESKKSLADKLPLLDGPPMTVAVYGFIDKTGQNKPNEKLALFSKAVTQGAETFLIKALKDSKNWF